MTIEKLLEKISEKKLTLSQLAKETGIAQGTLSKILQGKGFTTEVLDKLCKYFDCQPGDLVELGKARELNQNEEMYNNLSKKDFSKLKVFLDKKNISSYEMAKKTGLSTTAFYYIIEGKRIPRYETVAIILEELNCTLEDICDYI